MKSDESFQTRNNVKTRGFSNVDFSLHYTCAVFYDGPILPYKGVQKKGKYIYVANIWAISEVIWTVVKQVFEFNEEKWMYNRPYNLMKNTTFMIGTKK